MVDYGQLVVSGFSPYVSKAGNIREVPMRKKKKDFCDRQNL